MNIKTKSHFRKLIEIIKEDGFLTALDYDYQVTRFRHPFLNWIMEDIEYLKAPSCSCINGSPARNDCQRVHYSKHYIATYSGRMYKERLTDLQLR